MRAIPEREFRSERKMRSLDSAPRRCARNNRVNCELRALAYQPTAVFSRFSIFAQVSRKGTVRLNTRRSVVVSESTQKYPRRSNWKRSPASAFASDGSSLQIGNTSSELGLRLSRKV